MRPDSLAAVVFAIFIKEHIPSSAGWRRFAVINGVGLPRFGFVNDHEAAAAEISGPRKRYRQSEPDRNGRVDFYSQADALASTANFLRQKGWRPGLGYQPGEPNFRVIEAWNAAGVYQKAIAIMAARIDGG